MINMNDILNPPKESAEAVDKAAEVQEIEQEHSESSETATGEAAASSPEEEAEHQDTDRSSVDKERAALAKERERVRRKEAELLERESRLNATSGTETGQAEQQAAHESDGKETADPKAELKELRSLYRDSLIEGNHEEMERLEELIDEKLIEVSMQRQSSMSAQQREQADWNETYTATHDEFPFLKSDHPQASAELNNNINTYLSGAIAQGRPRAKALKEAVNLFAPAYAEKLGLEKESVNQDEEIDTSAADKVKERLKKQGFAEVRSASNKAGGKPFNGITPMNVILGKTG